MNTDDLARLAARWEEHSDGLQLEITVDDQRVVTERVDAADIVNDVATTPTQVTVRTLGGATVYETICPHGYLLDGVSSLIDTLLIPGRGRARAPQVWDVAFWARADAIITRVWGRER